MERPFFHRPRRRIVVLGLSILFYAATVLVGFLSGFSDTLQTWKGYYSLVIPARQPLEEIDAALVKAGIRDSLSARTVTVELGIWNGSVERLPLERARSALLPDDPRRTPWLDLVDKVFHDASGENHVIYLPQHEPLTTTMLRLESAFRGASVPWQVVEWNPGDRLILAALVGALALALVAAVPGRRLAVMAAVIPWTMVALGLGPRLFPYMVVTMILFVLVNNSLLLGLKRFIHEHGPLHFFWELVHKPRQAMASLGSMGPYFRDSRLWLLAGFHGLSILVLLVVAALSGDASAIPGLLLLALVNWPSVWIWAAYTYTRRSRGLEHKLFFPVPILDRLRPSEPVRLRLLLPATLGALVVPLVFMILSRPAMGLSLAVPDPALGSDGLGYSHVRELWQERQDGALPDISLAMAHRLRQESLAYLPVGTRTELDVPPEGQALEVADTRPGRTGTSGLVPGDAWFARWRSQLPESSVEGLLLGQGQAHGLAFSTKPRVYSVDFWSLGGLLGMAVFWIPLLAPARSWAGASKADRHIPWRKKTPA